MLSLLLQAFRSLPNLFHITFSKLSQLLFQHHLVIACSDIVLYLFLTPLQFEHDLFVSLLNCLVCVSLSVRHILENLPSLCFLVLKHLQIHFIDIFEPHRFVLLFIFCLFVYHLFIFITTLFERLQLFID